MFGVFPDITHFHIVMTLAGSLNTLATVICPSVPLPTRFQPCTKLIGTFAGDDKKKAGQEGGAKAWIVKPFQPAQMLAAVSKLII